MGNYYCGPTHPRFGQNFFSWFTGNPAWLLRVGFDEICGVKPDFNGLRIAPVVPSSWQNYSVCRQFRGCVYTLNFKRATAGETPKITVNGQAIEGNLIPLQYKESATVEVVF